ncbi:hypothetical protein K227x_62390 [Rubripirellula lacrimiformis]|uniref:Uncharacterized protein n=1 Tax=Rubripirellula lacrimiformis TaxID=1930273 RepID=A0A517NL10_9BACT|nr:hypothetical protein [Rubripirellula lacrimiformis]QDT07811.1 hypothetical protein K227x_62390 [Rubripirellula lacrimiformis]
MNANQIEIPTRPNLQRFFDIALIEYAMEEKTPNDMPLKELLDEIHYRSADYISMATIYGPMGWPMSSLECFDGPKGENVFDIVADAANQWRMVRRQRTQNVGQFMDAWFADSDHAKPAFRIVDMRQVCDGLKPFAVWDVLHDRFLTIGGHQVWDGSDEFLDGTGDALSRPDAEYDREATLDIMEAVARLLPDWTMGD